MFNLHPITGTFGAEVDGIDLADDLTDAAVDKLQELFVDHKVLVFREQHRLTPERHIAFARRFGEVQEHEHLPHLAEHPEVILISDDGSAPAREMWHSDISYAERPSSASILRGNILPDYGRDTMFADMEAVLAGLSAGLREMLSGLRALHDWRPVFGRNGDVEGPPPVDHPVVRTHPVSGRQSLYVNQSFTTGIVGFHDHESGPLLRMLYDRIHLPEYQLRVRWTPGTVTMWDNRSVQHAIVRDRVFAREMQRVTLLGERPV
jgi:taurine dioxygenase